MTCEFASSTDNAASVLSAIQQLLAMTYMNEFTADDEQRWKAKRTSATGHSSSSQEYLQVASMHRTDGPGYQRRICKHHTTDQRVTSFGSRKVRGKPSKNLH